MQDQLKAAILMIAYLYLLLWHADAHSAKTIYRCVKDGQITLTDKPCDGSKDTEANTTSTIAPPAPVASVKTASQRCRHARDVGNRW